MAKKQNTTQQQQNKLADLLKLFNVNSVYPNLNLVMQGIDKVVTPFKPFKSLFVPNHKLIKRELPYNSNPQGIRVYDFKGGRTDKQLAEGTYPYANAAPYKGVKDYDIRNIKERPIINYQQYEDLLNDTTGKIVKFDNVPYFQETKLNYDTAGGRNNNPCNISIPVEFAVGAVGTQSMADGQRAGKFDNVVDGVASTMRLYREYYGNRSFPQMNNGLQGYYSRNEPIGLSALRLYYVTNKCKQLGIDPNTIIDTDDKWTLCSFVNSMAQSETGSTLSRETLDEAYKVAFGE